MQIFDISPVDSLDQTELIKSSNVVAKSISNGLGSTGSNIESNIGDADTEISGASLLREITQRFDTVKQESILNNPIRQTVEPKPTKAIDYTLVDEQTSLNLSIKSASVENNGPESTLYRVELGDTATKIANSSNIDVDSLRMLNHIGTDEALFEGQMLYIPTAKDLDISLSEDLQWPFEYKELPFVISQHFNAEFAHEGIDFALPKRSPIRASASGLVTFAGWDPIGYGNMILVYHGDNVYTLYAHLESIKVALGDEVRQGAVIGYAGSTGFSTDTHLHFEIIHRFESLNPCTHIAIGCHPQR